MTGMANDLIERGESLSLEAGIFSEKEYSKPSGPAMSLLAPYVDEAICDFQALEVLKINTEEGFDKLGAGGFFSLGLVTLVPGQSRSIQTLKAARYASNVEIALLRFGLGQTQQIETMLLCLAQPKSVRLQCRKNGKGKLKSEEGGEALKSLEKTTLGSKREIAALDEMKPVESQHATVSADTTLEDSPTKVAKRV
nr:hypothetical protein CFP56_06261 [Quercus suber]